MSDGADRGRLFVSFKTYEVCFRKWTKQKSQMESFNLGKQNDFYWTCRVKYDIALPLGKA